jgi:hypothetical protein
VYRPIFTPIQNSSIYFNILSNIFVMFPMHHLTIFIMQDTHIKFGSLYSAGEEISLLSVEANDSLTNFTRLPLDPALSQLNPLYHLLLPATF